MDEIPQRVLVVTPHPDDAELWCGGTLARWIGQGAAVSFVLCTDGSRGSAQPGITPQELTAIREQEQRDAANLLGVRQLLQLRYPDGGLEDTAEFRKELVREIRRVKPEVVLVTEPYRRNLAWHRDHRIAGQVALDAVFPYARDHLHFAELWQQEQLEPHNTGTILFWGTEQPDTFIDIAATMETKLAAVQAHRSQVADHPTRAVVAEVMERARADGELAGCQYAEAFRKVTFRTG